MAVIGVGANAIGATKIAAPRCAEYATMSGLTGKGLSFGLGIGLGAVVPTILALSGLFIVSKLMRKHMADDILMHNEPD